MKYTIAFDVYGTLINTSGVFNSLEKMIGEKAKPVMNTWRNKQLEYSFRRGLMNKYVDFSVCTKDALEFSCKTFKVSLTDSQKIALMNEYKVLPAFPDVKEGLQKIKEDGHKLYAFSNGSANAVSNLLINAEIINLFDGVVSVEDVQVFKPSPLVYKHFNDKTNSTKIDSWLISSNPFDVIGATAYGMNTAWVQRSQESIFDPWGIEPTTIINGITELSIKLKELTTKKQVNKMETNKEHGKLDDLLKVKREESAKNFSEEKRQIYADGIADVKNSGILDKALNVGQKSPNFNLNNATNKPVSLYEELKNGPVILTWYRGGWCPYCNITLHFLQERLPDFQKAGATLIALTPELPDKSLSTSEKHNLEFTVLSDVGNKVGKEYGVVYQLTTEVASIYESGFGMNDYNGDESNELPLAATYVIDQNGTIKYAFLDADYRNRAEPDEIIAALNKLK